MHGKSSDIHDYTDREIVEMVYGIYRDRKFLLVDGDYFINPADVVKSECVLAAVSYIRKPTLNDCRSNSHNTIDNISQFYVEDYFLITKNPTIGMLGVQYTYFAAIKHSNAATATVLQFAGPILIAVYLAIKNKKLPNKSEAIAILLAVTGTFLLVTHASLEKLSISGIALYFGIASAVTLAFYTLQPKNLLEKDKSATVVGWGMLVGGLVFSFVKPPWQVEGIWDIYTWLIVAFIIIFGTLIAFYSYLSAVKIIGGQKTSLLASSEPLVAVILSVLWLDTPFALVDWIGTLCIISTVFLMTRKNKT